LALVGRGQIGSDCPGVNLTTVGKKGLWEALPRVELVERVVFEGGEDGGDAAELRTEVDRGWVAHARGGGEEFDGLQLVFAGSRGHPRESLSAVFLALGELAENLHLLVEGRNCQHCYGAGRQG